MDTKGSKKFHTALMNLTSAIHHSALIAMADYDDPDAPHLVRVSAEHLGARVMFCTSEEV
jgi:hypothetical protein